jgi:hypothetical protein
MCVYEYVYIYVCDDDALATRAGHTFVNFQKTTDELKNMQHFRCMERMCGGGSESRNNHTLQIEGEYHAEPMENYFINMDIPLVSFFGGVSPI